MWGVTIIRIQCTHTLYEVLSSHGNVVTDVMAKLTKVAEAKTLDQMEFLQLIDDEKQKGNLSDEQELALLDLFMQPPRVPPKEEMCSPRLQSQSDSLPSPSSAASSQNQKAIYMRWYRGIHNPRRCGQELYNAFKEKGISCYDAWLESADCYSDTTSKSVLLNVLGVVNGAISHVWQTTVFHHICLPDPFLMSHASMLRRP
jgi:hypothetical protein